MAVDTGWREKELSLKEVIEKYPEAPEIWALKVDVSRRGVQYTDRAFVKVDPQIHHVEPVNFMFGGGEKYKVYSPIGLTLRDGSVICGGHTEINKWTYRDPYTLDVIDDKLVLVDEGEVLEEV